MCDTALLSALCTAVHFNTDTHTRTHKQQMDNNFSFIKLAMTKTNCLGIDFFAASRVGVPANAGICGGCLGVLQFIHWAGAVIHHNDNNGRTIIKSTRVNQKSWTVAGNDDGWFFGYINPYGLVERVANKKQAAQFPISPSSVYVISTSSHWAWYRTAIDMLHTQPESACTSQCPPVAQRGCTLA